MKLVFLIALFSASCSPTRRPKEKILAASNVIGSYKLSKMECDKITYEFSGMEDTIAISNTKVNIQTVTDSCTKTKANYSYSLGSGTVTISGGTSSCSQADCKISYNLVANGVPVPTQEDCVAKAESEKKLFFVEDEVWIESGDCILFYLRSSSDDPGASPF